MKQDESMDEEIRPSAFFSVGNISCERDAKESYKKITSFSPTTLDYSIFALEK